MCRRCEANESRQGGIREAAGDLRNRAGEKLGDVRHRAADAYGTARDRAAGAYGSARERAASARQRVGETAEEYATRAREEAAQAAAWARRQPDENPMGTTIAAFALGALIGAVLPRSRAENRAMGQTKSRLVEEVKTQADAALEAGKNALSDAGITTEAAKAKLAELTEDAKHVAKDVAGAAASKVKVPSVGGGSGGMSGSGAVRHGRLAQAHGRRHGPTAAGTPGPAFTSGSAPVGGGTTQSGGTHGLVERLRHHATRRLGLRWAARSRLNSRAFAWRCEDPPGRVAGPAGFSWENAMRWLLMLAMAVAAPAAAQADGKRLYTTRCGSATGTRRAPASSRASGRGCAGW
jgi:ElaB/YqjD/DUF883 family membrane-anchored ribosome-binding protein